MKQVNIYWMCDYVRLCRHEMLHKKYALILEVNHLVTWDAIQGIAFSFQIKLSMMRESVLSKC